MDREPASLKAKTVLLESATIGANERVRPLTETEDSS